MRGLLRDGFPLAMAVAVQECDCRRQPAGSGKSDVQRTRNGSDYVIELKFVPGSG
ncbi:MAG: hypothetical protein LBP22_01375 [Deltaproteobacteria bacterium]|nr:hypothetical protein [Deltaproteobacteria bacterium]